MLEKINARVKKVYDALEQLGKRKEALLIWSIFAVLVFGVVIITGTITSGFHLVDDWQFAEYVDRIAADGFAVCLKEALERDFILRFRPLYFINRVITAAVFGINLTAISTMNAIEIIVAMGSLYYCARHMHCNVVYSILFALTVMVGYQSAVWWKLGPQESYGIMLFSCGFLLLLNWLQTGKKYQGCLSMIFFVLASIYKESFMVMLPFVMLYIVYDGIKSQDITIANLWSVIKKKLLYLSILAIVLIVELCLMVFVVGVNNYSYVGLDSTITLSEYCDIWSEVFRTDLKWYFRFGVLFIMIALTYWEQLKKLKLEILLALSVMVPQFVIYSKSGITERYILPWVFGFAYFFAVVCCNWKALSGKRRIVYMLGLWLMLAANARAMLIEANYFTYRGNSVQTMLDTTLRYTQEAGEDVKVLSCLTSNTEANLTMKYWMRLHGYEEVYYWQEDEKMICDEVDDGGRYQPCDIDFEQMDIIIKYNREDRHWVYDPSLDFSDFTEKKCGTLTMYFRK